ncbi:hypothetical protein HDE68_000822 [Pedobacter cryoconitis]|uniref:Uncharacterized protein n=1 Tax=Pedobacter cryoconitis TaxID=188932 RepID=A0A7W8ZJA9_9SPHI|nr:hypothetical protein [Pedobacter cryoconitis]MBB5634937.1 hypothetical protein [Pedobacter cryoconitis]
MKKILLLCCTLFVYSLNSFAQMDTIYSNNQKIACSVKEVTEEGVKFSHPNEDLVNSVYKNSVQKIVFKSGRVQVFTEASSFKAVTDVREFDNVTVTAVESEVKGLYKIGDVSSKAKGTTGFSNQERVKDRAYRKLKIQAAMMGANIVYLTNQRTEGNKAGGYFQAGSTAETNLTGVSYSNVVPSLADFKKLVNGRTDFATINEYRLGGSSSDYSLKELTKNFFIANIRNDNGIITIEGELEGLTDFNQFRLVGVSTDHFNIFYRDKSTVYNISVKF